MKTALCLTILFSCSLWLQSCGDDTGECTSHSCAEGCCLDNKCMDPSPATCGLGICVDCTADPRSDTCSNHECICQAEGARCGNGQECTSTGCTGDCIPDCTGKCAGADDGCQGTCADNDCAGCCDAESECIPGAAQDNTRCGTGGAECVNCTSDPRADSCSSGACVCAATGTACDTGKQCTSTGCVDCIPDCTGQCQDGPDGCGGTCPGNDCSGCCAITDCIAIADQIAALCGTGGVTCIDCGSDYRADSCSQGACVCAATGSLCGQGEECTQTGCESCSPDCTGKCLGNDDGCGGSCNSNDCDGCCTTEHECIGPLVQSDRACGKNGELCMDCEAISQICDVTLTCQPTDINNAGFVLQNVPATMTPSQVVQVSVTMVNAGTSTWTDATGHRLGSQNPQDNTTWGLNRVYLDAGDSIGPGQSKTFTFQVTAPAAPGAYSFQWRMVQDGVEWFGEFSTNVPVDVGSIHVCEAVRALAGTNTDASTAIQTCINNTPSGETLELPAGVYRMDHQVQINARPITLRTEGKNESMPKCATDNHDCAELKASTSFIDTIGILRMLSPGTVVDHIVVNGNKVDRRPTSSGQQCQAYNNQYGYNIQLGCNNCTLTNSVTKNALCGTGCEVSGARSNVRVWRNTIAYNGVHNLEGLWADGLTVHDAADSTFTENEAGDNTDIDIIFGGCQNCVIQNNSIWHTDAFAGASFAALMIHAWPNGATSGNFNGSVTSGNSIDCGSQRQCGIGLYIGPDAWYDAPTFGGSVHDNTVANAEFGLLIDDANDMQVYNNPVTNPATFTTASCGLKFTYDYGIGQDSANIDTSQDTLGTSYHDVDFDGCIPKWWNQ